MFCQQMYVVYFFYQFTSSVNDQNTQVSFLFSVHSFNNRIKGSEACIVRIPVHNTDIVFVNRYCALGPMQ